MNQLIINLNNNLEEKDDDYLSYYINFLKVISNKINKENIKFIFNTKYNIFPLLDQILLFLNNDDIMIRNSARNIFLSFIKLNYAPLIEYLCDIPRVVSFIILMRKIKTNILLMINLKNINKNIYIEKTKEFKEKIVEDLLFIQDILSINIDKVNYIIINCFFSIIFLFLFNKIISFSNNTNNSNIKSEVSKSINIFRIIFKSIKNEYIKNIICFIFFSKKILRKINQYLMKENKGENKENKIENMIYPEIKEISNILKTKEEADDIQLIIQYLNEKLVNDNSNFIKRMYNFHCFISEKTGIDCGIYHQEENDTFLSILYNNFLFIRNQEIFIDNNYFIENLLRKEILCFLENEIKGNINKNIIFNIILFFIEIINDKHINIDIKEIINIIKNNNNKINNIIINNNKKLDNLYNSSKSVEYPNKLVEPVKKEDLIIINNEKITYKEIILDKNFFAKINKNNYSINNINNNSDLIIIIIDFIFYSKFDLNNNDILLCFKLIESLYLESNIKYDKLEKYMKSLYYQTLLEIKEILLKNNNDLKNRIFKFSYSLFEKAFYSYKKTLSEIIDTYYSDMKLSSFVIIENSPSSKEKTILKNLFQKYISLHDLLIINSYLFKNIDFPLKLIKDNQNFEIGGKVDINEYNLDKLNIKLYKIINNSKTKEEKLTMFIYNNYLFFALSPENVAKYDINAIEGEKLYLIKYMFCLRYINLIKDIDNDTLFFIFDENEYKFNLHIKFDNNISFNKAKELLVNGINNSIILEFSSISSFINNQIVEYNKYLNK